MHEHRYRENKRFTKMLSDYFEEMWDFGNEKETDDDFHFPLVKRENFYRAADHELHC
jgi:hypothetical protein